MCFASEASKRSEGATRARKSSISYHTHTHTHTRTLTHTHTCTHTCKHPHTHACTQKISVSNITWDESLNYNSLAFDLFSVSFLVVLEGGHLLWAKPLDLNFFKVVVRVTASWGLHEHALLRNLLWAQVLMKSWKFAFIFSVSFFMDHGFYLTLITGA